MRKRLNQKIHMILLTVGFNQLASKVITYPVKVEMKPLIHTFSKDLFPVFGYKDQM